MSSIKSNRLKVGKTVYHVANAKIPGVIKDKRGKGSVGVEFTEPVGFSGNTRRGKATYWVCSTDLLYHTAEEAHENDKFKDQKEE